MFYGKNRLSGSGTQNSGYMGQNNVRRKKFCFQIGSSLNWRVRIYEAPLNMNILIFKKLSAKRKNIIKIHKNIFKNILKTVEGVIWTNKVTYLKYYTINWLSSTTNIFQLKIKINEKHISDICKSDAKNLNLRTLGGVL